MKWTTTLKQWAEAIRPYSIPLVAIGVLVLLVGVLYEGKLSTIQKLLLPPAQTGLETERLEETPGEMPLPAGIQKPPAQPLSSSTQKEERGEDRSPDLQTPGVDTSIADLDIESYLNALTREQADRMIPLPPAGEGAVAPSPLPSSTPHTSAGAPPGEPSWIIVGPPSQSGEESAKKFEERPSYLAVPGPSAPSGEKGAGRIPDVLVRPDQEVWIQGKSIPIDEMTRIIREKRPSGDEGPFGLRVVQPGDNIWDIHYQVIRDFFWNRRGIRLPPLIDEPDQQGRSSGVGKILKFSETIGVSYNLATGKIVRDPNLLVPGQEIYFFRMKDILGVVEGMSVSDLDRIRYDGKGLYYSLNQYSGGK